MEMDYVAEMKILVAMDESDQSKHALTWCFENLLRRHRFRNKKTIIFILYCMPQQPPGYINRDRQIDSFWTKMSSIMEEYGKETSPRVMQKAKEIFACYTDLTNVKLEGVAACGDARDVICNTVNDLGVDLLVMGSHGYGFQDRGFLGSVSTHCAQAANCPVLLVKNPHEATKDEAQTSNRVPMAMDGCSHKAK